MKEQPISRTESEFFWGKLKSKWQVDEGCWFPLRDDLPNFEVLTFHKDFFDHTREQKLRETLKLHGVNTVLELREGQRQELKIDIDSFEPYYSGLEGYWVDQNLDWLVYASHEASIALAGSWLVKAFRDTDPGCELLQYRGPFSTSDRRGAKMPPSLKG